MPSPIHLVSDGPTTVFIARPGARYAVAHEGDELRGVWLLHGEACAKTQRDHFTLAEGALLLPFLRARIGGRPPTPATTPEGRLIDRACRKLGLSAEQLAAQIGADKTVLSRARTRSDALPSKYKQALHALLASSR